jgi:hypothetical protein
MKKTLAVLFLSVSSLFLLALDGGTSEESPGRPSFSRGRWLEEREAQGARFTALVGPLPQLPARLLDRKAKPRPPRGLPTGVVRVSGDLLEGDGGAAQPETQAEPFLAIDPGNPNRMLAGYQEGRFDDGGCRALTLAVSSNGGRTWREALLPNLTRATGGPWQRTSDPWVAFGPGGRAYYVSLGFQETQADNGVFLSTSEDGGLTWGDPVAVHLGGRNFDDKEAVVVDTRSDSPYRSRVYVAWDWVSPENQQPVVLSSSDDGGASFSPPVFIRSQGNGVGVVPVVGPGGVLHAVWLNFIGFSSQALVASRSTDGGATWSAPVTISSVQVSGVPSARTSEGLPSVAVDPRNGSLYVAWQDDRATPGVDHLLLSRSTDGGETWSSPRPVADGPPDAPDFTPAVAVTPEGLVGVAYYSLRNDPDRAVLVDEYLVVSRDGGQSFGKSQRVTARPWDLRDAAFTERGFFLGDYQGLVAASKRFHPFWVGAFLPSRIDPGRRQPDALTRKMTAR